MSDFIAVSDILSRVKTTGGSLVGQGNEFFAGDYDEFLVDYNGKLEELFWEIRNKITHTETYIFKDLLQFANIIKGRVIEQHGITTIATPQGYPVDPGHNFNIKPAGTGNIMDYEAKIIKVPRTMVITPAPMSRNVADMHNYKEPTGQ